MRPVLLRVTNMHFDFRTSLAFDRRCSASMVSPPLSSIAPRRLPDPEAVYDERAIEAVMDVLCTRLKTYLFGSQQGEKDRHGNLSDGTPFAT